MESIQIAQSPLFAPETDPNFAHEGVSDKIEHSGLERTLIYSNLRKSLAPSLILLLNRLKWEHAVDKNVKIWSAVIGCSSCITAAAVGETGVIGASIVGEDADSKCSLCVFNWSIGVSVLTGAGKDLWEDFGTGFGGKMCFADVSRRATLSVRAVGSGGEGSDLEDAWASSWLILKRKSSTERRDRNLKNGK